MNNYSQSANPNATNSELDSKKIVTNRPLTSAQRDELIEQFVEIQVDNMDTQTLVEWVTYTLIDDYGKMTDSEIKERVDCYNDDGLYEELVDNITNTDPTVYNTNGGKF
jgi:DNA repair ATPase RecN